MPFELSAQSRIPRWIAELSLKRVKSKRVKYMVQVRTSASGMNGTSPQFRIAVQKMQIIEEFDPDNAYTPSQAFVNPRILVYKPFPLRERDFIYRPAIFVGYSI